MEGIQNTLHKSRDYYITESTLLKVFNKHASLKRKLLIINHISYMMKKLKRMSEIMQK